MDINALFAEMGIGDKLAATGVILGMIGEILSFFVEPLKRKDRLGHPQARLMMLISLLICLTVLLFDLSFWYLFLTIIPFLWLLIRWMSLRIKRKEYNSSRENRDLLAHAYIDKLCGSTLFEWEIRKFLLPSLVIFFEIGAIKRLKNELSRLTDYRDNTYIRELESLISAVEHRPDDMEDGLKNVLIQEKKPKYDLEYAFRINNLYHAAMTRGDNVSVQYAFGKIENYVGIEQNPNKIPGAIFEALLYRYDRENNLTGVSRTLSLIANCTPKTFRRYLDINDTVLAYHRRHNNWAEIIRYLDEAYEKLEELEDNEEQKILFRLRMAQLHFEYNYGWREITAKFFHDAGFYLSYSKQVAIEYVKMVIKAIQDAGQLYAQSLLPSQERHLADQAVSLIEVYMQKHKKEIFEFSDELLYRKRDYYRFLIDYARLLQFRDGNIMPFVNQMIESDNAIIALCRKNGEVSELIRAIVVYIDDFISIENSLRKMIQQSPADRQPLEAMGKLDLHRDEISELLSELCSFLKRFNYDRTLAYDTLYAAHFCFYFNHDYEGRILIGKFDEQGIGVDYYRKPVQQIYHNIKQYIRNCSH